MYETISYQREMVVKSTKIITLAQNITMFCYCLLYLCNRCVQFVRLMEKNMYTMPQILASSAMVSEILSLLSVIKMIKLSKVLFG